MRALAALLLPLALACASLPPVETLDAQRRDALVNADVAALRDLFADDLRYGHANGVVESKAELLDGLASGRLDYRAIRVEASETHALGGASVVTGRQTIELTAGGRELTSHSVFTAVYARAGGRWQLVAYQSTPLPPPASGAPGRRAQ